MKKLCMLFIALAGLLYVGLSMTSLKVQAEPILYDITFQSMFDANNLGTPTSLGSQAYHTTIQLESNVNAAVSPEGDYVFAFWVVNGIVRKDLAVNHLFVIIGPMDIIAVFSKTGEHAVLFMDSNAKFIAGQYVLNGQNADDSALTLPDKPGHVVHSTNKWDGSLLSIIDDTVLTLQYEKSTVETFTLTVTNGSGSGSYNFNDVATVIAADTGTPFSHWIDQDGIIVSTVSTYAFSMLKNISISAVYQTTPIENQNRIIISEDLEIRTGHRSYIAQFYIPAGYQLIDIGMLTLTEDKPIVDFDTPNVGIYQVTKYFGETKEFVVSLPITSHYSIRAYLVVEDSEGVLHRFYSEKNPQYVHQGPVDLGAAYNFAILSSTAISTTGLTQITGDVGLSPAAALYITGFSETIDGTGTFATSIYVNGKIYAADYTAPTPAYLTTAVGDMGTAYTDAASRTPDFTNVFSGDLSGQTLAPGVYKFDASVIINADLTLSGSATDTWIFQVTGNIAQAANIKIILTGGAVAENIVWQVAGRVDVGVSAHFVGTILCKTSVHFLTSSTLDGRILAQTATTLDAVTIS